MGGYEDDILRGEDGNDKLYGEFGMTNCMAVLATT